MAKTIYQQELRDGASVECRDVYIRDMKAVVVVTTEDARLSHDIKDGSFDDALFYCYTPSHEFETMDNAEFEDYVNENY